MAVLELLAIFAYELRIEREVNGGRTGTLVAIEVERRAKVRIENSQ